MQIFREKELEPIEVKLERAQLELTFYEEVLGVSFEEVITGQEFRLLSHDGGCLIESIKIKQIPKERLTAEDLRQESKSQKNSSKKLT